MEDALPLLIAIVVLIVLSACFSAIETAYTSLNVIRVKSLALKESRYKKVLDLYDKYDKLLSTILIGNNIVNITASSLALLMFQGLMVSKPQIDPSVISTIVMTVAVLLFGEITPKYLAKTYPEKFSLAFYPFIIFFYYVLYPLNLFFGGFKWLIGKIFRLKEDDAITNEELITIVNEAEEDGTLKEEESNLIKSAIEFDDLEVKDILVPRINVIAIPADLEKSAIKKVFENERYSRLPIYNENIDSIIGVVHEKDFYRNYSKKDFDIRNVMQEACYVVEHTKISVLLKTLQKNKMHMAIVLDEYGGTLGIVTIEDIIEELVGEIYDEHDEETVSIRDNLDGTFTVNCATGIDEFFEKFNLSYEEEFDANTVGGWVTETLGELPKVGRTFDYESLNVRVSKTTLKKVVEIVVKPNEESQEDIEE